MSKGVSFRQFLAVDPGCSHAVLSIGQGDRIFREPSLVALAPRKGSPGKEAPPPSLPTARLLGVGAAALALAHEENPGITWVRGVEQGRVSDRYVMEAVLRHVLREAPVSRMRSLLLGARMTLVVSPQLEELDRLRHQELLRNFGFGRIRTIDSLQAAAVGGGLDIGGVGGRMVIDLGGGTTRIAAFSMGEVTAWHWHPFGGLDLDRALEVFIEERYRIRLLPGQAEQIKMRFGSVYPRAEPAAVELFGPEPSTGIEKKVTLDDNEIRDVLLDACEPLVMTIQQGFERLAPELAADIIQAGVTMVGGGAMLSGLSEFLQDRIGLTFHRAPDPINAVIRGALWMAWEERAR